MELTVVNNAIFQEGLTQMNPLFRVIGLSDLHQPRHKLTKKRQRGQRGTHKLYENRQQNPLKLSDHTTEMMSIIINCLPVQYGHFSVYQSINLSIYQSIYLSIYLSIYHCVSFQTTVVLEYSN